MLRYEVLEHTADLMIRAYGSTLEECYANMCYGMFDQTVALDGVQSLHRFRVEVDGVDDEDALYSLLSELLYLECTEGMVLCEFSVTIDGTHISCDAKGEALDWDRMEVRGEIKAVTFHDMEIDAGKPEVTVLFDVRSPHAPMCWQGSIHRRRNKGAVDGVLHLVFPRIVHMEGSMMSTALQSVYGIRGTGT